MIRGENFGQCELILARLALTLGLLTREGKDERVEVFHLNVTAKNQQNSGYDRDCLCLLLALAPCDRPSHYSSPAKAWFLEDRRLGRGLDT